MRHPLLMLIPAVLMAQRSALPPAESFDRELKRNRLGTWLVLEDEGAAWGAVVRAALDEEALAELNLPLRVVSGGKQSDALAAHLRDRYGWAKGAHWALVDAKGRILAEGSGQPTASGLVGAAEQAGILSRTQELTAFLRQHPDHLEAQGALLRERVLVANRRTRKRLGPPKETVPAKAEAKPADEKPPEPPRELDAEADLQVWSQVAGQLDDLFTGAFPETAWDLSRSLNASLAEHSPVVKAVLARHRGDMEEALRRRPNAAETWMVWLMASRKCGGWPLRPLIQSLQPLPGTGPAEWPPMMVQSEFIKDARARRDWAAIRELLEPRWEGMKTGEFGQGFMGNLWAQTLSPLLEALVAMGAAESADQVLNEALSMGGSANLPGQARDLATRLNRPDLAARWGALTPKGR
ncbi:MAG TPA: hypothetical protein VJ463_04695 [Geothrix sp.]|nr:hypothetical protein [Geothrix sp.]